MRPDDEFCDYVAGRLAGLPGVRAVTLGGSRAAGTQRPDSDWDFAIYYRGAFSPASLRAIGWPGEVFEIGGWGGGVFNGGAWLQVDGRKADVHYRDLDEVDHQLAEARAGRFGVEKLLFYLAGVPTYILAAELASNTVLRGDLPRPAFPDALRAAAPPRWWGDAQATLAYGRGAYAARGKLCETAGTVATAACQSAHAVLAATGQWVINEKTLLDRADLRGVDELLASLTPDADHLTKAVDAAEAQLQAAVVRATTSGSVPGSPVS
ncbi:MAG TPA: nucleotidyltransferase domain-containing protein [Streptosporangiaceae bacterium]|nr:nucleotidyltransferase domain-containing protein [Streptosporangiaceae bacterium]